MSHEAPPSITASPAAPDRADRTTFSSRATAWADWLKNAVSEIAAVATNVYNNAVDASASAASAADSEANAAASAAAAASASGALPWAAGTYSQNNCAISQVDFQTYRKITPTSMTTVDPADDIAGDWVILGADSFGSVVSLAENFSVL